MNVLFISECGKQALEETRRVLDQFAERKGSRVWQTPITQEGLKTVRSLLRKTARKNTAVACYWIRKKNCSQLMWIVGNKKMFNEQGSVPTNRTTRNRLDMYQDTQMNAIQTVALIAGIAGLFHDFGKASILFQQKLEHKNQYNYEPSRHEWISIQLFQKFVAQKSDTEWLTDLYDGNFSCDGCLDIREIESFDIADLPPLAQCISWLILSHHRLPVTRNRKNLTVEAMKKWAEDSIDRSWNSLNHTNEAFTKEIEIQNFTFPKGLPWQSKTWCLKAKELSKRALCLPNLAEYACLQQALPMHLSRLALMLADHAYSVKSPNGKWQDPEYQVAANTDAKTGRLKQQLDEHCVGVAQYAYLIAKMLPRLQQELPVIEGNRAFKVRAKNHKFKWQDRVYDQIRSIASCTKHQGFFGVNIASTGTGKTFANARVMYALSESDGNCRFSIGLGLRSLTLQTGQALRNRLGLNEEQVGVRIGSQAFQSLYEDNHELIETEVTDSCFDEADHIDFEGDITNSSIFGFIKESDGIQKLLSSPILVSTIDYLMPASEGIFGGHQIAPILRLFTSDLVLDEPDDFELNDDPALARLVFFAGMMGSRVLLSSATLPKDLVTCLFESYRRGRRYFNAVTGEQKDCPICCAAMDEFGIITQNISNKQEFSTCYKNFIELRAQKLIKKSEHIQMADWLVIDENRHQNNPIQQLADAILKGIYQLSQKHKTRGSGKWEGKTVSTGIVRIANINPMVQLSEILLNTPVRENTRIHYCIYHSQYPLIIRSNLEKELDVLLKRDKSHCDDIFEKPIVKAALQSYPEDHHLFVVLATPVAEVGRDHDYDWAIIEPSSMRSIIQMSGRVQRHRRLMQTDPNILILNKNLKAIKGSKVSYSRPGYESDDTDRGINFFLKDHDLRHHISDSLLKPVNSRARIQQLPGLEERVRQNQLSFIDIEHIGIIRCMHRYAEPFLEETVSLIGELQKQRPFREGEPSIEYVMLIDSAEDNVKLCMFDPISLDFVDSGLLIEKGAIEMALGVSVFIDYSLHAAIRRMADRTGMNFEDLCKQFSRISLRRRSGQVWLYNPILGVFGD